jgi:hypothetical protein
MFNEENMRVNSYYYRVSIILVLVMVFILASNALGQNTGSGGYRDGYGSSGAMVQNPDDLMKYGRDMMRYGFH